MVDVGDKPITGRRAVAQGQISMQRETLELIISGQNKKGDVLAVARIAGIMGAKRTSDLIPLCHPLSLTHVNIEFEHDENECSVICTSTVETQDKTGVEMEALNAVQVSLLTIYDMCKATDRGMIISAVQLMEKSGGRSGDWKNESN